MSEHGIKWDVIERVVKEFGPPVRETSKVKAWNVRPDLGLVVQFDQPNRENAAYLWLPFPPDSQPIPDFALEYPAESGRHSNTYPSPGLGRGLPALKLIIRHASEIEATIAYVRALRDSLPLPEVHAAPIEPNELIPVDVTAMPPIPPPAPRREAIPRPVQREVWQRDGGKCVECGSREKLCFDHIVPHSRGGGNTMRNVQLLCETCNLSKGNRI